MIWWVYIAAQVLAFIIISEAYKAVKRRFVRPLQQVQLEQNIKIMMVQ